MNIFVFDKDPRKCAEMLDDARLNKMIVETCQILSTALHLVQKDRINKSPEGEYNLDGFRLYKPTHEHHPVVKWVAATRGNYLWTWDYLICLFSQYSLRRRKPHSLMTRFGDFHYLQFSFPDKGKTPFVNCARNKSLGVDYTHVSDVHEAYKLYIQHRWRTDKRTPKRAGVPILERLDVYNALVEV
jgi:hypothetical protein